MKRNRLFSLLLALVMTASLVGAPLSISAQDNLALGATAIASSEFNSGFGIAKLNDGKGKTGINGGTNSDRWSADWGGSADNAGEWFGVAFSEKTAIDTVVFYEYNSRMTEYTVEYQDEADGEWKTVTKDGQPLPNQTKEATDEGDWSHSVENTVTFDLTEVFGIRVYIVAAGIPGVSIWEFETYNNAQPPEIDATTNLAVLKGTGIADSDKSVGDSRFQAVNLNDGSTSGTSRWSSDWGIAAADVVGCWAGIQFDEPTVFNKLTVKEFHGRVTGFVVEVSNDGQSWTPVTVGGEPMQTQVMEYVKTAPNQMRTYDVAFDRVQAAYVRYRIVEAGEAGPSLWELEVYDTRAGYPFPEEDNEEAFRSDVDSVTEQSLLGDNPDAQNITANLTLPTSPLSGGTSVAWSVTEGAEYLAQDGTVTRPAFGTGDQTAVLQAAFTSPLGTYTETKTFSFTILQQQQYPEGTVLLHEDYTKMPEDTNLADYNWSTFERDTGDIVHAANGTIGIQDGTLEIKKTVDDTTQGYGLHKSFQYYERPYASEGTVDETRTAVWADKLKGVFDVEVAWRFSGNEKANYIDFQGQFKKGGNETYGSMARYKVTPGTSQYLAVYNNGSFNGQKESQLYRDTTQTHTVKARFDTEAGQFQVFLDGAKTPADALNVTQDPKNVFEMTDYSKIDDHYYMDNLQIYLAKEQPKDATICIDSFSLAQVEAGEDAVVDNAVAQLTMDQVCDTPEDVAALKTLPKELAGATISWESSHPEIISNDGTFLSRPAEDTDVILTAAIANPADGFDKHKEFKLTVKAPEADDEAAFRSDVDSVTEQSLLGANPDAQHVTENLTLTASPMAGGTNVVWSVVSGGQWVDAAGKVTRPTLAEGDQTVQLKAAFSSPLGTYTEEKTFTFTILLYDPAQEEKEAFEQDVASVTEDYLLGANPSAQQVKWDLNLPVSPLPNGTEVAWSVQSGTAIDDGGNVTRPAGKSEEVTLRASFTKSGQQTLTDTRDFTFTVLPQDMGVWKLVENIQIEDPRGASTYTISQIKDGVNSSTAADGGVRFGQLVAQELASSERPDMKLDFSDSIQAGKKYYIEVATKTDMKQGETRVTILNGKASEGALFIFRSNNTLGLAADPGSGRTWVDSQVKINHTHGAEETFGIYYDTSADKFQFVSNGEIASSNSYKPSYGGGISGVQVSYQGKAGDLESYTITKGVKVYEYDPDWASQIESEFAALSTADLTSQDPAALTQDMTLPATLPCGAALEWESSHPQVIAEDGTVTMPSGEEQEVQLTVRVAVDGIDLTKTFDVTVLSSTDPRVILYQDMALVTYESLTEQDPSALTQNLTMPEATLPGGTAVAWTSSNPAVLAADGTVTQPEGHAVPVMLTAAFTYGGLSAQQSFWFTVSAGGENWENLADGARTLTSAQTADGVASAVVDGDYQSFWTTGTQQAVLTLELTEKKALSQAVIYENGASITSAVLEVSDNNVDYTKVADVGSVGFGEEIRFPIVEAKYVRLRVTGQEQQTVSLYEIELYFAPTDEERVTADVAAFTYTNPKVVTADIELPTQSRYGSTITWSSNKPESLDAQGHVVRQSSNVDVTLTATFTSGEVQKAVQVYHTVSGTSSSTTPGGGSGGGGGGGGGNRGGSSAGNSGGIGMSVPVVQPDNGSEQPTPQTGTFRDVTSDRWSYTYIERLAQKEIVDGNGDTFDPEGLLTREQLVKLIVTALGLALPEEDAAFTDVQPGAWYSPYIAAAAQAGIVSGMSETEFGIGQYVSREDMATMICRAMESAGVPLTGGTGQTTFADSGQISAYAQESVRQLTSLGILSGDGGYFLPQDTATREQGAKVICMVLDKMGR